MKPGQKQEACYRFLKPGMKLSLSLAEDEQVKGVPTSLIGFKPSEFIVLDVSDIEKETLEALGQNEIIVRGLTDSSFGHVVAFRSHFVALTDTPIHQLYVSPPEEFISKPIREHSRYKISVPCSVSFGDDVIEGIVRDFSVSGCGIYTTDEHEFIKGLPLRIECELNRFLPIGIQYEVVSVKKHDKGTLIGIRFTRHVVLSNALKMMLAEWSLKLVH